VILNQRTRQLNCHRVCLSACVCTHINRDQPQILEYIKLKSQVGELQRESADLTRNIEVQHAAAAAAATAGSGSSPAGGGGSARAARSGGSGSR
jgi:hypothetical protein